MIYFSTKVKKSVNKVLTLVEIQTPFNIKPYWQIEIVEYKNRINTTYFFLGD